MKTVSFEDARRYILGPLLAEVSKQRWFPGNGFSPGTSEIHDFIPVDREAGLYLIILRISSSSGNRELYQIPVRVQEAGSSTGGRISFDVLIGEEKLHVSDAVEDHLYQMMLISFTSGECSFSSDAGTLSFHRNRFFSEKKIERDYQTRTILSEQSNSSVVYGHSLIWKSFRKLSDMPNPDYEVPLFLNLKSRDTITPAPLGYAIYENDGAKAMTGVLSEYVENRGEAWGHFLKAFSEGDSGVVDESRALGHITAVMHNALSAPPYVEGFEPEPMREEDALSLKKEYSDLLSEAFHLVSVRESGYEKYGGLDSVYDRISGYSHVIDDIAEMGLMKIRIHGDYHLGQVLMTEKGYRVIDFEGEPARPPKYRRSKHCALKDLGGMIRSLDYAASMARKHADHTEQENLLIDEAVGSFVNGYWESCDANRNFVPADRDSFDRMLEFFVLEKALYEVRYEALYRPEWLWVPMSAVFRKGEEL